MADHITVDDLARIFKSLNGSRRDSYLAEVDRIERDVLGYGTDGTMPRTAQIRAVIRRNRGCCPHCGGRIVSWPDGKDA